MALRLREVALTLEENEDVLPEKVAGLLGIQAAGITDLRIVRRGIDARKKSRILRVYTVEFWVTGEDKLLRRHHTNRALEKVVPLETPQASALKIRHRVLVVGMGPAGLFAALQLARYGMEVTLVERGRPVEQRVKDVRLFWQDGTLDPSSNIQFGEGGAGTFSDGKLTTRVNNPWMRFVLEMLVGFGAPGDILSQAKPHVGSDRLRLVLVNFRKELQRLGVDIRFSACLTGLDWGGQRVQAGILDDQGAIACDSLVLAPGHSARDTYRMLHRHGVALQLKPFAVGLRVEHPAALINTIQYGMAGHPNLPTADYSLTWNDPDTRRGIYSFCMCPGGEVVNAASEAGGVVVNGMSLMRRSGERSNSALVVAVRAEDLAESDPLAGVRFQRRWEEAAFAAGGRDYRVPAQNLMTFLGKGKGPLISSCRPGVREAELDAVLPPFVTEGLRRALPHFDRRMRGFVTSEATLAGIETRTSAPVRIVRDQTGESISHPGLYPVGEGAGYAGGIMSAALDGLRAAENIVQKVTRGSSN